ncbi:hypothetical protein DFH08DRAFT_965902 [Mycena albidolilacea]|uniref:Uncharacterized protein n=1 Tax=Mycena albidolilacea TaxID=1033008 RepID=A0AAD6ZQ64_9AGAR|nr:hypothetical protein DFH08DRAFT_965902 [Mycena albidolilacea]
MLFSSAGCSTPSSTASLVPFSSLVAIHRFIFGTCSIAVVLSFLCLVLVVVPKIVRWTRACKFTKRGGSSLDITSSESPFPPRPSPGYVSPPLKALTTGPMYKLYRYGIFGGKSPGKHQINLNNRPRLGPRAAEIYRERRRPTKPPERHRRKQVHNRHCLVYACVPGLKTVDRVLERIRIRNTKAQRAPLGRSHKENAATPSRNAKGFHSPGKENAYSSRAVLRALV